MTIFKLPGSVLNPAALMRDIDKAIVDVHAVLEKIEKRNVEIDAKISSLEARVHALQQGGGKPKEGV